MFVAEPPAGSRGRAPRLVRGPEGEALEAEHFLYLHNLRS